MKKLKNFLYLIFFLTLTLFVRCDYNSQLVPEKTVGVLVAKDYQSRWQQERLYFRDKLADHGINMLDYYTDAENLEVKSQDLLSQNIQVLIIISDDRLDYCELIQKCHLQGIQVISYERLIHNCKIDFHIGFDEEEIGRTQARHLVQKYQGNYLLINGSNSFFLKTGQMEILTPYIKKEKIKIVGNFQASSTEEAYLILAKFINQHPETKIDVILTSSDFLAGGVIKALEAANLKAVVSGKDASVSGCRRILEGKQEMSVYLPTEMLAQVTAEISGMLIHKQEIKTDFLVNNDAHFVPTIMIPSMIVNKNSIKVTVIKGMN
jgi:D-xylose transport system substrate-binding protein